MVGSILIALQASRRDGRGVTRAEFLEPLKIRPGEVEGVHADAGTWADGLVYFAIIRVPEAEITVDGSSVRQCFKGHSFAQVLHCAGQKWRVLDCSVLKHTKKLLSGATRFVS